MGQPPFGLQCTIALHKMKQNSVYTSKITNGAENGSLKVGNTVMEVLYKSHYGKDYLQMGRNPITLAEDSGLKQLLLKCEQLKKSL